MQLRPRIGSLILASIALAQEPEKGPAFLRPLHESVLEKSSVPVIARTTADATMMVDGKSVASTSPASGVLTATLELAPGPHELALSSGQKIQIFVAGKAGAPAGWNVFRPHPPSASCDTCHSIQQQAWSPKGATTAASCVACHMPEQFPKKHTHTVDVLEECQLCHQPHGSAAPAHLKFTKDIACKQCHG